MKENEKRGHGRRGKGYSQVRGRCAGQFHASSSRSGEELFRLEPWYETRQVVASTSMLQTDVVSYQDSNLNFFFL